MEVDFIRSLLSYIHLFPSEYTELILISQYTLSERQCIEDYLCFNPIWNRPLDLILLFASIDPDLVHWFVKEDEYGKVRLVFHYRMPNCLIDDLMWSVEREW